MKQKIKMKKKARCFFCGDYIDGEAHKELCLGWKAKADAWLVFLKENPKPNRKTNTYRVFSKCSKCTTGIIKWHPAWRHYCYFPTIEFETILSDRCLLSIAKFIGDLNNKNVSLRNAKED